MIHTIYPHINAAGLLVFDAPEHGLIEEPFVNGADAIILRAVEEAGIPDPGAGFELRFSADPDAGLDYPLDWVGGETIGGLAGNWYYSPDIAAAGWLCPALLCYYETPPRQLYFQVAPLPDHHKQTDRLRINRMTDGEFRAYCGRLDIGGMLELLARVKPIKADP